MFLYFIADAQPGWSKWSNFGFCDRKCIKKRSRFCYSPNGNNICNNNVHGEHIQVEQTECSVKECSGRLNFNVADCILIAI